MQALLSIKPQFAEKIFSGEKQYEYRKTIFKKKVEKVMVYSTMPIGKIVGEFFIDDILAGNPDDIWDQTNQSGGVNKHFYEQYFRGKEKGYAIKIGKLKLYDEPVDPEQSTFDHQQREEGHHVGRPFLLLDSGPPQ